MKLTATKALTATALAGAIGLGSLGVAALNPLGIAGAQETGTAGASGTDRAGGQRAARSTDRLQARVQDGTITQQQADRIEQRLRSRGEDRRDPGRERLRAALGRAAQTTADTIGITPEVLRDELRSGTSIAQVATRHGVDPQQVVDALVADLNAQVDRAVAEGRLTSAQADRIKSNAPQRIGRLVERSWGQRPADG